MNQIISQIVGFAVLTSPLFLIVLWIPVCVALAVLVGRKFIKKSLPITIAGAAEILFIAIPLSFEDFGAAYSFFSSIDENVTIETINSLLGAA